VTFQPGATIGVLGSGQLGRMFAMAAHRLGYHVHVYSPDSASPAGQVADREFQASYLDEDAVRIFARSVDVVTLEFENIPVSTMEAIAQHVPVAPGAEVLSVTRNRLREKSFLSGAGLPVVTHRAASSPQQLQEFMGDSELGAFVLKSVEDGYDGKGQTIVSEPTDAAGAFERIGAMEAVAEHKVDLMLELSVVGARSAAGEIECFGPVVNYHENHILDVSVTAGSLIPDDVREKAMELARTILDELHVVGILTVEFFYTTDGELLINELAPRPHNSGHLSIEAAVTSQFEQQVRAVCGLPLGSMALRQPAAMANLLGDHLLTGKTDWQSALSGTDTKLHLYGKSDARIGRKMGHLTATATSGQEAESAVRHARDVLQGRA
jgi:5-(carboxyamino)imidazole ribonucleotide synthase